MSDHLADLRRQRNDRAAQRDRAAQHAADLTGTPEGDHWRRRCRELDAEITRLDAAITRLGATR